MTADQTPAQVLTPPATPPYPLRLAIEYPDRTLDRFTSFFRILFAIPIYIVLAVTMGGASWAVEGVETWVLITGTGTGVLFLGPLLMILFRQKYPRWWFDFSLQLMRFEARVWTYLFLMTDKYPSTDEEQSVRLDADYPDAQAGLDRWLPLVKWLLAIPHYIVLFFLWAGLIVAVLVSWFAILFTGGYPRGLFDYVAGVMRWTYRVSAYALLLNTDRYPPFQLT